MYSAYAVRTSEHVVFYIVFYISCLCPECALQSLLVITMLVPPSCRGLNDSKDETAIKRVVMATQLPTLIVSCDTNKTTFKNPWARLCLAAVKRQSPIIHHPHHHKRQSLFQCHVGLLIENVRNHILQVKKKTIYNSIHPV